MRRDDWGPFRFVSGRHGPSRKGYYLRLIGLGAGGLGCARCAWRGGCVWEEWRDGQ